MHHVRGVCVGRASSADDSKASPGSSRTVQPRNTAHNKTHFRTIAPKVAPKVVPSCTPSFAPAMADISAPSTKPFVMQPQNYALMKVPGQDGTFSLVALPQVSPPMGGPVIQTTGVPLQENLKLPIPRYQTCQEKKLLNTKSRVQIKPKVKKSTAQISQAMVPNVKVECKEEPATRTCNFQTTTHAVSESGTFCEAQVDVHNPASLCVDKVASLTTTTSPMKLSNDIKMPVSSQENEIAVKCEEAKVADPTNPAAALSPVVFGSPVHLLSSAPKGKVAIMPYSKIKKSIISSCKPLVSFPRSQSSVAKIGMQTSSSEIQTAPLPVPISKVSITDHPNQPMPKPDVWSSKQNVVLSKKRGMKLKSPSDVTRYQAKMRLVGHRLILCKERVKSQTVDANDRKMSATKKYRNIMPKPFVGIQGLVSLSCPSPGLQTHTGESAFRNRMTSKTHRWRPSDRSVAQNDCKMSTLAPKLFYKCPMCDHSFQFKHHLQDHLNSHSNKRPYHCRLCRKAYVHSGSLSTHMKLHHSDNRLKKLMCCEFCAKVFGHIRVYFGHLKEVHRVIISTVLSTKQVEKKNLTHSDETSALDRDGDGDRAGTSHRQMDDIRLQIICCRCYFIASTFSDMKAHLFCEHGDEFQETIHDGILKNQQGAQEEVVKNATHQWKLLREKENVLKNSKRDELSVSGISDSAHSKLKGTVSTVLVEGQEHPRLGKILPSRLSTDVRFCRGNVYNCLLCKQSFEVQSELFEHWEKKHNCEDPSVLWTIFSSFTKNDKESF